ncbi:MAG: septation protein SpoVG family protein [Endomicrobiia bacterium]
MKKIILSFFSILLLNSIVLSQQQVYITSVEKTGQNEYSITLNDLIVIKEIKLKKTKIGQREISSLEFPTYISRSGKAYPQVSVLSKELNEKILNSINSMKSENMPQENKELSFKIGKYSPYRRSKSSLKVFASIVFADSIEIECKIMEGKKGPWISWPSRKDPDSSKWVRQVSFKSKEYQKKVESELLNRYKTAKVESNE